MYQIMENPYFHPTCTQIIREIFVFFSLRESCSITTSTKWSINMTYESAKTTTIKMKQQAVTIQHISLSTPLLVLHIFFYRFCKFWQFLEQGGHQGLGLSTWTLWKVTLWRVWVKSLKVYKHILFKISFC